MDEDDLFQVKLLLVCLQNIHIFKVFASYLCKKWNERDISNEDKLVSFQLYVLREEIQINNNEKEQDRDVRNRELIWIQYCE